MTCSMHTLQSTQPRKRRLQTRSRPTTRRSSAPSAPSRPRQGRVLPRYVHTHTHVPHTVYIHTYGPPHGIYTHTRSPHGIYSHIHTVPTWYVHTHTHTPPLPPPSLLLSSSAWPPAMLLTGLTEVCINTAPSTSYTTGEWLVCVQ